MDTWLPPQSSTPPPGALPPPTGPPLADDPAARWPPWTAITAPLMAIALSFVAAALVVGVGSGANWSTPTQNLVVTYLGDACFVAAALWFASRVAPPRPEQFGLRRPAIGIGMAVLLVIAAYLLFLVLAKGWTSALNLHENDDKLPRTLGAGNSHAALVAVAVLTCVVAPICEEFLFRGYMYRALRNWRGVWPAALIIGLVFGGFHVQSSPIGFLFPLALFGVILCFVYEISGSLYPGIATHAVNNSLAFAVIEHASARTALALLAGSLAAVTLLLRLGVRAWRSLRHVEPAR